MIFAVLLCVVVTFSSYEAFGDSKIPIMSHDQREQVFSRVPNFQGSNINYFFQIIITPTGVQANDVTLDQKNYTALKNNVGFFTACGGFNNGLCEPPVVTSNSPTMNYCPLAKMILVNQDGYLNKTYTVLANGTLIKDLTGFIYPSYCYTETGPNPINGNHIVPVPEFPVNTLVLVAIFSIAILINKIVYKIWPWEFGKI